MKYINSARICLGCFLLIILFAACSLDNDRLIQSNEYLCQDDTECKWGWKCESNGSQGYCVNPNDQDAGIVNDDAKVITNDLEIENDAKVVTYDTGEIICVPNEIICSDLDSYFAGNESGTAHLGPQECPPFERCENGSCVAANRITGFLMLSVSVHEKNFWIDRDPEKYNLGVSASATFLYDAPELPERFPSPGPEGCQVLQGNGIDNSGVPFDAGEITFKGLPGGDYALSFDPTTQIYSGPHIPGLSLSTFPFGQMVTFNSPGKGLVDSPFSGTMTLPPKRMITTPIPHEKAIVEPNQPFTTTWSGATGTGQIGMYLGSLEHDPPPGPLDVTVYCQMDDDGEFTVPADIMSLFSPYPRILFFFKIFDYQTTLSADGLTEGEVVVEYTYWPRYELCIPSTEICNNFYDDNCNGEIDEGCDWPY